MTEQTNAVKIIQNRFRKNILLSSQKLSKNIYDFYENFVLPSSASDIHQSYLNMKDIHA